MHRASFRALKLARPTSIPSFIRPYLFSISSSCSTPSAFSSGAGATCALMGKGGFYAVRNGNGGFNGVLTSWSDAEIYITGAKGCQQKKFRTRAEAEAFVNGDTTPASASASLKKGIEKPKSKLKTKSSTKSISASAKNIAVPKIKGDVFSVYTDGACTNNGQFGARAGYGVFFGTNDPNNISEPLDGKIQTNQRAEMTAVLHAMRRAYKKNLVTPEKPLRIYTDSSYTLKGMTQWIDGWKKKGWKTAGNSDVKNRDLWEELDYWKYRYNEAAILYELVWVKGHNNDPGNEAADRLAVAGAAKYNSRKL